MQNDVFVDRNIGPAALRGEFNLDNDHLLVHSIFGPTFQGEMPLAGQLAIFIRLAGCNRGAKQGNCGVQCDTNFRLNEATRMSVLQTVAQVIHDGDPVAVKLVVISGGEPLMQPAIVPLMLELQRVGYVVQVESNGDFDLLLPSEVIVVISPKAYQLGSIDDTRTWGFKPLVYQHHISAFRCVVTADARLPHYTVPSYAERLARQQQIPIYLSPMTVYRAGQLPTSYTIKDKDGIILAQGEIQRPASSFDERERWLNEQSYLAYLGWYDPHNIINRIQTGINYQRAVKLALEMNATGIDTRLSMQTHLFFGVP